MTSDELIGNVAASYLRDRLTEDDSTGVARYLLDCLTADQTAAVAKTILADALLSKLIEIKLPVHFVGSHGLPSEVLTHERTTYFRNAACPKSALLVANTGDDEEQSLKELVPIGAPQLQTHPALWVRLAAESLPISDQHKHWWVKALEGLLEVRSFALDRFAEYVLQTRKAIEEGQPVLFGLGVAFPALHVPKDTAFFCNLNDKTAGHLSKWKALYAQAIRKRGCYLVKQTPTQALLLEEDLAAAFEKVKDAIPDEIHPAINSFIRANSGWNKEAADLAVCEWELVKPLFDGLRKERFNLGKATLEFYDEREADLLTGDERDYLARLRDSNRSEAQDEDEEFYRRHRNELKEQPSLKAKWDRFIFGTPIETEDFLLGIALCLEWLFDQDMPSSKRRLKIACDRRTKKDLKELNEDAGLFFARRYQGLKALFGNRVSWDVGDLMGFEALSDQWRKATRPYVNRSVAKSALQLKFVLELEVELSTGTTETFFKQLVWKYDPNAIASEFSADWLRLAEHPLVCCRVNREPVSGEGRYQSLDLRNIRTLYAAHGQDRRSFVSSYICDSARLPYALVDKMNELHEDEEDMRCQIFLRHRDGQKLRELYEKIIESSDADADSFVSSEAAKDFMARLRISIMADQAPIPDPKDGPPHDIVFLQDVIARHARLEWYPEKCAPVDSASFIPARWSRRRPAATDDMKSVVYLCCPVQSQESWSFITALTTFIKGDWDGVENKRLLPARQLDFNDPLTASIFKEIHYLGNWVVNFDELLDRRQLLNQNVKVIRYRQGATQGRNILISSTAPLSLLRSMVLGRVKDLNLELTDAECRELTEQFIDDANEISGDIVLRAAKRGRNASELMGVVLSRYMIRHELGTSRRFGWYFLDDYAEWLGQREEQIADILALSPEQTQDGKLHLAVIIAESKYIDAASVATKRKESQKQLRDTVRRINDAIFGDPKRLDRDLWLSRFSDLMLNGIQFPANAPIDLAGWRKAVRDGECGIHLRGYSHIFVSGPSDSAECSGFAAVAETEHSYQEVFSRARLRELVLSYWNESNPTPIRKAVAGEDIWQEQTYRKPSERIQIVHRRKSDDDSPGGGGNAAGGGGQGPQPKPPTPTPPASAPAGQRPPPVTPAGSPASWAYTKVNQLLGDYHGGTQDSTTEAEWLKQVESLCKGALQQFQLQSKLLNSALTPNAALLKFQGSANLTVEQVLRRRSEFLTTHKLNVISVRAEPGVVAIAIARLNRRVLHLPEVWKSWNPDCSHGNHDLLIAVKEEDSSRLFLSPKSNAPHTLIAGSTGSGKSVLMQNIILGIACTNTRQQAKIVLIDPKLGVDYFAFEGLPHLQGGIIDDQDNAVLTLNELVGEMNRRYTVLKENKVSNIFDLNKKANPTERLPFLWVIHDEFAEWMMTEQYAEAVSDVVGRLGVKARAAGISLVFAAQRPDANVMPMQLRANLGNRLVLRVDGEGTSEIALGEKGAERLLGKGHLAAKLEGASEIIFGQVPFVDSEFLSQMVTALTEGNLV